MFKLQHLLSYLILFFLVQIGRAQEISTFPYFEGFESDATDWNIKRIQYRNGGYGGYYYQIDSWEVSTLASVARPPSPYQDDYAVRVVNSYRTSEGIYTQDPYPELTSPTFVIDGISKAILRFRYHMWLDPSIATWLSLEVMVNNGGEYVEIWRENEDQLDVWKLASLPLDSLISSLDETTKLKFRFRTYNPAINLGNNTISIDNFEIKDIVYKDQPVTDATNWIEVDTTGIALTNRHMAVMSTTVDPDHELWVNGSLKASEVLISVDSVPDYVFEEDYDLLSLEEIDRYVKAEKHLPGVPSESEYKADGVDVGKLNMILLKKIEELTLHMIELKGELKELKQHHASGKTNEANNH